MLEDGFYFQQPYGTFTRFNGRLSKLVKNSQSPAFTPDELTFVADRNTPIAPLSKIVYVQDKIHVFNGFVTRRDSSTAYLKCTCKSAQWALSYRYLPELIYHNVDLNTVFASNVPTTGASGTVGALFAINSMVPNGKWAAHSSTVAKLANGGTKSILGTVSAYYASTAFPNAGTIDNCDGVILLTLAGSIPSSNSNYYMDYDDFYVKFGDGTYRPNAFYVFAENAFDTGIRLGSIDIGAKKSNIDFSLAGVANSSLEDFFLKAGREVQFRPNSDGYTYLHIADDLSRDTGKQYIDGKNASVDYDDPKEPAYQVVIGLNDGNNPQPVVATNWSRRDPQIFKVYEDTNISLTDLQTVVDSMLDDEEYSYKAITTEFDWSLRPGDYIDIYNKKFGWKHVRITSIEYDTKMTIKCGKRLFSPSQAFGSYFKKTILKSIAPPNEYGYQSASREAHISGTTITGGSGSFVVYHDDYNAGGWTCYYEESFSPPNDDESVNTGVFCDVMINGIVVPPGRIRISDSPSISIDITAACSVSTTSDITNTVLRNIYLASGWDTSDGTIKQYRAMSFIDP